jgi:hypothetical protein
MASGPAIEDPYFLPHDYMRRASSSAAPWPDRGLARPPLPSSISILCARRRSSWLHPGPFSSTAHFRQLQVGRHARRSTALPPLVHCLPLSLRSSSPSAQAAMVDWNSPAEMAKDQRTSQRRRPVHALANTTVAQASPSCSSTCPSACTCGSSSSRSTSSGSSSRASASSDGQWYVVASCLCHARAREEAAADASPACRSSTSADVTACWPH